MILEKRVQKIIPIEYYLPGIRVQKVQRKAHLLEHKFLVCRSYLDLKHSNKVKTEIRITLHIVVPNQPLNYLVIKSFELIFETLFTGLHDVYHTVIELIYLNC